MDTSIIQIMLIGLVTGLAGLDILVGLTHFHRPVVLGPIIGLILGDVQIGIIVGAMVELSLIGAAPLAGAQPPNVIIAGMSAVFFAISITNLEPEAAVALSLPFAALMQAFVTLMYNLFSVFTAKADKAVEETNFNKITILNLTTLFIVFISYFILSALIASMGEQAQIFVNIIPTWILNGLTIAGGMMPAMGLAILLSIMFKKEYAPFLIIGFVLSAFFGVSIIALTLIAISIAMYDMLINKKIDKNKGGISNGKKAGI